jgi:hypothetical protein
MPLYLTDNPSGFIPFLHLVMEFDHLYLNVTLWRTTCGPLQVRLNKLLEAVVARKPDEVSDPLLFAELVDVWVREGCIPPEPKLLIPGPVAVNQSRDKIQDAFG